MYRLLESYQPDFSYEPKVTWEIQNDILKANFELKGSGWNCSEDFSLERDRNWGLWDYDVVEIFLQKRAEQADISNPYYEFQISPLGQRFTLEIFKPRELICTPINLNYDFKTELIDNGWKSSFEINLNELDGQGEPFGNFYSILGQEHRHHFALNKPSGIEPDFHQPASFIKL